MVIQGYAISFHTEQSQSQRACTCGFLMEKTLLTEHSLKWDLFSAEHRKAVRWIQEDQHSWLLASWLGMDELVWIKQQLVWLCTELQLSLNLEGAKQYKADIVIFTYTH